MQSERSKFKKSEEELVKNKGEIQKKDKEIDKLKIDHKREIESLAEDIKANEDELTKIKSKL